MEPHEASKRDAHDVSPGLRWVSLGARVLLSLLLIFGLGVSVYLTLHHESQLYGDGSVSLDNCPRTETIDCELVNTSDWSEVLGVPIAALPVPTYLLLLLLIWRAPRCSSFDAYAFGIGVATTLYSGFLLYVSKFEIGFLCLWCAGLYAVNGATPLLAAVAARRGPGSLLGEIFHHLFAWPPTLRFCAGIFVFLLVSMLAVQQTYRASLLRKAVDQLATIVVESGPVERVLPNNPAPPVMTRAADSPQRRETDPSVSQPEKLPPLSAQREVATAERQPVLQGARTGELPASAALKESVPPPDSAVRPGAHVLQGSVRRLRDTGGRPRSEPFDLQARLGAGRPVALIFWASGYLWSQAALAEIAAFLRREAPAIEAYAVAGLRAEQRDEEIWETFVMMPGLENLPLLLDEGFTVSRGLDTTDVPNLSLFDADGALVVAKIKSLRQFLVTASGNAKARDVILRVASGESVPAIARAHRYYPATELYGACAPGFTLPAFNSGEPFTFTGRSPAGRPTLIMFWSSTCNHCQIEIPQLVSWVEKHPSRVDIVSITQIKPDRAGKPSHREVTERYVRSQRIPWPVLEDSDGAVGDLYRSTSTPTTYFITAGGTVTNAWFYAHRDRFDQSLEDLLSRMSNIAECRGPPAALPGPRVAFNVLGPGGDTSLGDILDRPSLIHFWATWCAPCVKELPGLLRFERSLEANGARLLLVSVEDAAAGDAIQAFSRKFDSSLVSYRAPHGGVAQRLDPAWRVPRTYVVAPGGQVLKVLHGEQDWEDRDLARRVISRLKTAAALAGR